MDTTADVDARRTKGRLWALLVAVGLTLGGLLTAELVATPAIVALEGTAVLLDPAHQIARETFVIAFMLNFVGMAAVGALYLGVTGRGFAYVDLQIPSLRDLLWVLGGFLGVIGLLIVVSVIGQLIGVPGADHELIGMVEADPTLALYLIVLVFLFNAPAEEFLFRNVIQKRLYDAFTRTQAVVVASVIFAVIHFPVYTLMADSMLSVAVSILVIFGGSLIFGYLFVRTENLVVPILAHAGLNAFQFLNLYVLLEYFPEEYEAMNALLYRVFVLVPW